MENNKIKEILSNIDFGFMLFVAVLAYLLFLIRSDIVWSERLSEEGRSASNLIVEQEDQKKQMDQKLKLLDKNDYIENIARKKLGLVKRGEDAYIFIDH